MHAHDLMTTPVVTIEVDATVGQSTDLMMEQQISCPPIVNNQRQLVV